MDLFLLKTFLVLAATKNFTLAAQKLYKSQSTISLQISRLEALLGKSLFVRDNRNVHLTLEGEQLLGYAHKMLNVEEEMINHFKKPILKGEVTLGTPEDLATAYLPEILSNFIEQYPEILLNVHCELTNHLLNGFESQLYDLVLIKQDPQMPHPRSEVVWKESLVWVSGSKRNGLPDNEGLIPLVLAPSPCVYRKRAIDALNRAGIRWRVVYNSPSLAGILAAVEAGLGVAVLPTNRVPKSVRVLQNLPKIQDAQIALLKQENGSELVQTLSGFIVDSILNDAFGPARKPRDCDRK